MLNSTLTPMKECSKCGIEYPRTAEYFQRCGKCYDDIKPHCKKCTAKYDKGRDATPTRRMNNRAKSANLTARKYGDNNLLAGDDVMRLMFAQDGLCGWCYTGITFDNFQLDHMKPFALGGPNTIENVVLTCAKCNMWKRNKPLRVWLSELALRGIRHPLHNETTLYPVNMFDECAFGDCDDDDNRDVA